MKSDPYINNNININNNNNNNDEMVNIINFINDNYIIIWVCLIETRHTPTCSSTKSY